MRSESEFMGSRRWLMIVVSFILVMGFVATSLISYFVSRESLRRQIASKELPLTSDNVYSEIQRDLVRPIFISSLMANNTFLRDWIINGESDNTHISRYLKEIMDKYSVFSSFLVSESTRNYYYTNGVLKVVKPEEERDKWYFRVRGMKSDYEINLDPDLANNDAMTLFINHKVYDYKGNYIGATGVGLTVDAAVGLIEKYRQKYGFHIYFADKSGKIILRSRADRDLPGNIRDIEGLSRLADEMLSAEGGVCKYSRDGNTVHLHTRIIPELGWYLMVEQEEDGLLGGVKGALLLNLFFCFLVTTVVIAITALSISRYHRVNQAQKDEILKQHAELKNINAKLEKALSELEILSGFLPICSYCKSIKDDKGSWNKLETYLKSHSKAQFSHGICPDCYERLVKKMQSE